MSWRYGSQVKSTYCTFMRMGLEILATTEQACSSDVPFWPHTLILTHAYTHKKKTTHARAHARVRCSTQIHFESSTSIIFFLLMAKQS